MYVCRMSEFVTGSVSFVLGCDYDKTPTNTDAFHPSILTTNMIVLNITEMHWLMILNYIVPNDTFFSGSLFAAIFPISPRAARGLRAGPLPVQAFPPRSVLVEARRFYKKTNPH